MTTVETIELLGLAPDEAAPNPGLTDAAEEFVFATGFTGPEAWFLLNRSEQGANLLGGLELRRNAGSEVTHSTPLARLASQSRDQEAQTLLIAPTDVEVLGFERRDGLYLWWLRPVDKAPVRRRLVKAMARGCTLEQALGQLRDELRDASRAPITALHSAVEGAVGGAA